MAKANSSAFRINVVQSGGGGAPPYTLPNAGQAVAIGINNAMSIVPTGESFTTSDWAYSLFDSYGGGAFVPSYSAHGAYCLTGGGHNHPDNHGIALFDFSTAAWSRLDNANGIGRKTTGTHAYAAAETNGSPWFEIGTSGVPAPPHPYATLAYDPTGTKGSVIWIGRSAICVEATGAAVAHRFDLATRVWSRASTGEFSSREAVESNAIWDAPRNRWWYVSQNQHNFQSMMYLDRSDSTWKFTASSGWPSSGIAGYSRTMLHSGLLIHHNANGLWCFDPDAAATGWISLSTSGTRPGAQLRWARFGSTGNWYSYSGNGGNTINRIVPPASPKSGTWQFDTITVSGATLAAASGLNDPATTAHYTRFFYVDAIDCLAWVPGGSRSVYLLKPGS